MSFIHEASLNQKLAAFAVCLLLAPLGLSQEVVSVRAGFIHHTEGGVFLEGKPFQQDPANAVHVEAGQELRTENGRVEMMLALGTLLRLDENSRLEMIEGGMTSASARLISGSAIIDSVQVFDPDSLSVIARQAKIAFPKNGYYRIDAREGEPVILKVFRGKAQVSADGAKLEVKGSKAATIEKTPSDWSVAKFDRKQTDALDQWSMSRTKAIGQANKTLLARGSRKGGASPHFSSIPENGVGGARGMGFHGLEAASPLGGAAVGQKRPGMLSATLAEAFFVCFWANLDCRPCRALCASSIT